MSAAVEEQMVVKAIRDECPWESLPKRLQSTLQTKVVDYCIRKRLQWNNCFARRVCREGEYYEDMMRYLHRNLAPKGKTQVCRRLHYLWPAVPPSAAICGPIPSSPSVESRSGGSCCGGRWCDRLVLSPSLRLVRPYVHMQVNDTGVSSCRGSSRSSPRRTICILIRIRAPVASHQARPQPLC